ncbi:MAG TPA: nucleoside-diphosphate kinase [Phycisphaerae bacterium]|nr:nucleoside-diphosphate kinase [Phycisphaerae bacterium]
MERTLVMVKPDAVHRGLIGRIIIRFEAKGLKIVAMRMLRMDEALARRMYGVHEGKDFYEPLVRFVTAGPVVAMVLEGHSAVGICRSLMGPTAGAQAPAGTIRGDFAMSTRYNLVHGSDTRESAEREIPLFFAPDEIVDYDLCGAKWVYPQ